MGLERKTQTKTKPKQKQNLNKNKAALQKQLCKIYGVASLQVGRILRVAWLARIEIEPKSRSIPKNNEKKSSLNSF